MKNGVWVRRFVKLRQMCDKCNKIARDAERASYYASMGGPRHSTGTGTGTSGDDPFGFSSAGAGDAGAGAPGDGWQKFFHGRVPNRPGANFGFTSQNAHFTPPRTCCCLSYHGACAIFPLVFINRVFERSRELGKHRHADELHEKQWAEFMAKKHAKITFDCIPWPVQNIAGILVCGAS
jgi:hypothetical protein